MGFYVSNSENIDLDSFFANFKDEFNQKIQENNQKIAEQVAQAKQKAIDEIASVDTTDSKDEHTATNEEATEESKENSVVSRSPISVELPEVYRREGVSVTEEQSISDHLTQHWGF